MGILVMLILNVVFIATFSTEGFTFELGMVAALVNLLGFTRIYFIIKDNKNKEKNYD
jgi:hypothetical protein